MTIPFHGWSWETILFFGHQFRRPSNPARSPAGYLSVNWNVSKIPDGSLVATEFCIPLPLHQFDTGRAKENNKYIMHNDRLDIEDASVTSCSVIFSHA